MPSKTKIWKHNSAVVRRGDTFVEDGNPSDVVIVIMGPPGVGKSTFINTLLGKEVTAVGHERRSCKVQHIICPHPFSSSRRLFIVDTPGFDDTYEDDAEILRMISVWLATSYTNGMKLAGAIYLHDISQRRMLGTTQRNLDLFRKLCGDDALSSVVIGTTKWSEVTLSTGDSRLSTLQDTFWREMITSGSQVLKFERTQKSALDMVIYLLNKKHNPTLQLQEELVDLKKLIPDTDVGKELRYILEQLLRIQKDKATGGQIRKTLEALQALKVPISLRLKIFFGFGSVGGAVSENAGWQSVASLQTETSKPHEKVHCASTSNHSAMFGGSSNLEFNRGVFVDGTHASGEY